MALSPNLKSSIPDSCITPTRQDHMTTSPDTYHLDYHQLVAALTNPPRCPVTGKTTENEIKIVLGEHGIWPVSILPDVIAE
jgi:hypothetical protein